MKKVLAVLLVLAMMLSFAACGKKDTPAGPQEAAKVWPEGLKEVTVYVPQAVGAMLDQSTRIMVDYLNETYPNTKFIVENEAAGGGNKAGITVAKADGDGSVIMAHGAGAIIQFYSGTWEYNLADTSKFISICGNIGQLQPSGGVFLTQPNNGKFASIPEMIDYIKAHPGEVSIAFGNGTPHEIRAKLITNYYGVSDLVSWQPVSTNEARTMVSGGNVDVAVLTETTAVADIKGGKVIGILDSLTSRNYTDDLKEVLDNVPIVTDIIPAKDAEGLVCAWPMTIYGPASMSKETAEQISKACAGILDKPDYMARVKALGSSNTYVVYTYDEINALTKTADEQVKAVFEAFNKK